MFEITFSLIFETHDIIEFIHLLLNFPEKIYRGSFLQLKVRFFATFEATYTLEAKELNSEPESFLLYFILL